MTDTRLAPLELEGDEYSWLREALMALDHVLNVLLRGWHHETLSSRAWRAFNNGKRFGLFFKPKIDKLFRWQKHPQGHCRAVFERDLDRVHRIVKDKKP